jgi:hypothetical protein
VICIDFFFLGVQHHQSWHVNIGQIALKFGHGSNGYQPLLDQIAVGTGKMMLETVLFVSWGGAASSFMLFSLFVLR